MSSYLRPHYDLPHPDVLLLSSTSWLVAGEAVVGDSGSHCMEYNENVTLWSTYAHLPTSPQNLAVCAPSSK
jgi:hypothetical protein